MVKLSAQDGQEAHPKLHIITQNKDIRLRNTLSLGLNKYLLYYLEHSALPLTVPCHPERSEGPEGEELQPLLGLRHRILRCAQDDKGSLVITQNTQDGKEAHPKLHQNNPK